MLTAASCFYSLSLRTHAPRCSRPSTTNDTIYNSPFGSRVSLRCTEKNTPENANSATPCLALYILDLFLHNALPAFFNSQRVAWAITNLPKSKKTKKHVAIDDNLPRRIFLGDATPASIAHSTPPTNALSVLHYVMCCTMLAGDSGHFP